MGLELIKVDLPFGANEKTKLCRYQITGLLLYGVSLHLLHGLLISPVKKRGGATDFSVQQFDRVFPLQCDE